MADQGFARPYKRGKHLLPEKRLFQQSTNTEGEDQQASGFDGNHDDWCSNLLTPSERKSRARLLQQRHPPTLDLGHLPDDVLLRIANFLDAPSLLRMRCLNRKYRSLCCRNEAGWDRLCQKLWESKVHAPDTTTTLSRNVSMMQAYQESMEDARERHSIKLHELCYDPATGRGTVWSFRFKTSAGSDWTLMDPWYSGSPCRKMVFLSDGSIKQYVPGDSSLEAPRFGTTQRVAAAAFAQNEIPEEAPAAIARDAAAAGGDHLVVDPPMAMTWRLITRPMDLPTRELGSYVRISVGGRDVPTYSVRRSPTGNWGFIMESCWGLFGSFELPSRIPPRNFNGVSRRRILRRTTQGNVWVNVVVRGGDIDGDEDHHAEQEEYLISDPHHHGPIPQASCIAAAGRGDEEDAMAQLRDDTYMLVTNETQWREAFLYNVGARVLPEGDEATNEFDRAWGGL